MNFNLSAVAKAVIPLCSAVILVGCNSSSSSDDSTDNGGKFVPISDTQAAIYFKKDPTQAKSTGANYDGYSLYVWNDDQCASYNGDDVSWDTGLPADGVDEELGAYWVIDLNKSDSQCVNFIPRDADNNKPLGDYDAKLDLEQVHDEGNYVFTREGIAAVFPEYIPPLPANTARVYLNMEDDDISGMTLHVWNDATCDSFAGNDTSWDAGLPITGTSETYGGYWDIATKEGSKKCINFIPHRGEEKPLVENTQLDLEAAASIGNVAFTFEGSSTVYYTPMTSLPSAVMSGASAHWLTPDVMALPAGASTVELLYAKEAGIEYDSGSKAFKNVDTVISGEKTDNQSWVGSFPHLANLESWELDLEGLDVKNLLKGQLIAVAYDSQGAPELITQVQPAGVLDAIYTGDGGSAEAQSYGAIITDDNKVDFTLWAPTAQSVSVVKYNSEKVKQASLPMTFNELSGAWRISSDEFEFGDYFRYLIKVYHPVSQEVMEYEVTDPYSLSLSMNSEFSQVVDLNDPRLKPDEWDALQRPIDQTNPGQFVIYEAHVRDFSALDESTNEAHRGKFTAFTQPDTVPVDHLKSLSASGVTHLHLLPIFDIATINENPDEVANIDEPFSKLCDVNPSVKESKFKAHCESDSLISEVFTEIKAEDSAENPVVQELNSYVASTDSFNWGYDPFHYTVPEGSYATDAEGTVRIKELREAVMSIKQYIGMNVVMDVVYNHTNSAGPHARTSVLDKVVPWYYQRLNPVTGGVETSTCCSNTAPERAMFEKMITDSLVVWSQDYKIDSFRFDLMGHHPLDQMERSLQAVKKVDPNTYFYGEGWDFGEVAGNALFTQATQPNLGGTGIGSFSDRLRDAVRGGSPFDSGEGIRRTQGFGNGIYVKTNDLATANDETKQLALHYADLTRLGMAGNLKDFMMIDSKGKAVRGDEVDYNGVPAGYAVDPFEVQNYVSKHDNQTLWDNSQYKTAYDVTVEDRVRIQAVSLATAMLGQGMPFTHMGSELLRSKSMQRDSYDSGDWYNLVDFTLNDNNWDKGLPRKDKDGDNYPIIEDVIAGAGSEAEVGNTEMTQMVGFYKELAQLRKTYPLLALPTGEDVKDRVDFHNTGINQIPGLIVMSVDNGSTVAADIDPSVDAVVVVINATPSEMTIPAPNNAALVLSSVHTSDLATGAEVVDGKMEVPAWTPAVFVINRDGDRGNGIPVNIKK